MMRLLSLLVSEKREEKKEPLICKNKERGRKEKRFTAKKASRKQSKENFRSNELMALWRNRRKIE